MTQSTHVYSAVLLGTPDRPLSVKGGNLTLSAARAPHVSGQLDIAVPNAVTLAALDPRLSPRVRVVADGQYPSFSQHREFNLGIRDRIVPQRDGVVSIPLASDEALLTDYAPLADDTTPRASEASLRAVINYVLNKAIPGAALAASPSNDANVTRYWPVTNMLTNPSFEHASLGLNGWGMGTGASSPVRQLMGSPVAVQGSYALGWTAAAGDSNAIAASSQTQLAVTPGRWYVFAAYICSNVARSARAAIQWWSANGTVLAAQVFGSAITTTNTAFQRVHIIAQAPEGVTHAYPYINTQGNAAGNLHYVDAAMFYEGDELVPYFDGATAPTAAYTCAWSNVAHASTSTRTPVVARDKESLTWKAGQDALDFLAPLVQAAGYRLVCDEARVWTLRSESYSADGGLSIRHGINMIDGGDTISRASGIWFDAAVTIYRWTDANGIARTAVDAYALTGSYTRLVRFERTTPYPGPGFSQYAVRRAQGLGREVTATAVADWTARAEQNITVVLDGAPTQIGKTTDVTFNLGNDEMTVTTRTTDTPLGAIDLLTGTIDSLTGSIDSL